MRIVAGSKRGKQILAPEGSDTRPTSDRVREALFSSLFSQLGTFEGVYALDAFAGSGALGLEALSRGASFACFCEQDQKALRALQKNIDVCAFPASAICLKKGNVFELSLNARTPFNLVFLDPPYAMSHIELFSLLEALFLAGALSEDCLVVYEHAKKMHEEFRISLASSRFQLSSTKKYGKTAVSYMRLKKETA